MDTDRNGIEVLERDEALRLLSSAPIGRVGVHSSALPTVLPVNFVLTDEGIVFRTTPGTKLDAATRNAVVAFEVDAIDPMSHLGWSVVVTGTAREITGEAALGRARRLPLTAWANPDADRFVCISTELVSGRRLRPICMAAIEQEEQV